MVSYKSMKSEHLAEARCRYRPRACNKTSRVLLSPLVQQSPSEPSRMGLEYLDLLLQELGCNHVGCHHRMHGGRQGHGRRHRDHAGCIDHGVRNGLRRRGAFIVGVELVVFVLQVFLRDRKRRLTILLGLMDSTMSVTLDKHALLVDGIH